MSFSSLGSWKPVAFKWTPDRSKRQTRIVTKPAKSKSAQSFKQQAKRNLASTLLATSPWLLFDWHLLKHILSSKTLLLTFNCNQSTRHQITANASSPKSSSSKRTLVNPSSYNPLLLFGVIVQQVLLVADNPVDPKPCAIQQGPTHINSTRIFSRSKVKVEMTSNLFKPNSHKSKWNKLKSKWISAETLFSQGWLVAVQKHGFA